MPFAAIFFVLSTFIHTHTSHAFVPSSYRILEQGSAPSLRMGLYDSPLPPRPSPSSPPNGPEDNDEEEETAKTTRLFKMKRDGSEMNGLLPKLKRSSIIGGPQYKEEDPKVLNIVRGLGVPWEDAAWALEAYDGDLEESWMAVSIQQRKSLDEKVALPEASGIDWDGEFTELMELSGGDEEVIRPLGKDGIEERKRNIAQNIAQEQFQQGVKDFFKASDRTGAQDWIPRKNPTPDEDEPWFTG